MPFAQDERLLQAVRGADAACQAIVVVDADVVTHPDWLRELVRPLADERVGAACGIRWYIPESAEWGTTVRYLWNAAAEQRRLHYGIPWGGSLAVRRELADEAAAGTHWRQAFCEDVTLAPLLRDRRLQMRLVTETIAAVRESISWGRSLSFLSRQMTWVRLYHPQWRTIAAECLLTSATLLGGAALFAVAVWLRAWPLASVAAGAWGVLTVALCVGHFWAESRVFAVVRRRGGETSSPLSAWIKCFVAAPIVPLLQCVCLLQARLCRRVTWRGIVYRFAGPRQICLETDVPFAAEFAEEGSAASV